MTRTNRKKTVERIDAVVLIDIVTQRNGGGDYVEVTGGREELVSFTKE